MRSGRRRMLLAVLVGTCVAVSCGRDAPSDTVPASTEPPVSLDAWVTVTVHAGPTCPVEQPGESCPDAPVRAVLTFRSGDAVAATGETDANGVYRVGLPAGTYELTLDTGAPLPRCEPVTFVVATTNDVSVDVPCDSGIR